MQKIDPILYKINKNAIAIIRIEIIFNFEIIIILELK